jgi:hypothetical protein
MGAVPTANYITGPSYLLNWGISTIDKLDIARMRREAISFTIAGRPLARSERSAALARPAQALELTG